MPTVKNSPEFCWEGLFGPERIGHTFSPAMQDRKRCQYCGLELATIEKRRKEYAATGKYTYPGWVDGKFYAE